MPKPKSDPTWAEIAHKLWPGSLGSSEARTYREADPPNPDHLKATRKRIAKIISKREALLLTRARTVLTFDSTPAPIAAKAAAKQRS